MSKHESGEPSSGAPTICPECGHDQSASSLPRPISLTHFSRSVPVVIVLVSLVGFSIWLYATRNTFAFSMGLTSLQLVEPGITINELKAIANAPYPERVPFDSLATSVERLLDQPRMSTPGEARLEFTFADASGQRVDFDYFGWPTQWFFTASYPVFDDAVRRTGLQPSRTDETLEPLGKYEMPRDPLRVPPRPRWSWSWDGIAYQPPPEETGGITTLTVLFPFALAVPLASAVAMWWFVALAQALTIRLRWRRADRRRWPARLVAALLVIALLTVATIAHRRTESVMNIRAGRIVQEPAVGPTRFARFEDAVLTGMTESELRRMLADRSTFDSIFAHRLLELTPSANAASDGNRFLAIGLRNEAIALNGTATQFNELLNVLSRQSCLYLRRPEMGDSVQVALPAGTTWELDPPFLVLTRSVGDPNQPAVHYRIQLQQVALVILGMSCIAWLAFGGARLARGRLAKRRRVHNQCVACGHYLSAPPPR